MKTVGEEFNKEPASYSAAISAEDAALIESINLLIIDEWEAINGYKNVIQSMKSAKMPNSAINILHSIMAEEYAHVGELQKVLAIINPEFELHIESGKQEAEEIVK
jgi:rubrerythrin